MSQLFYFPSYQAVSGAGTPLAGAKLSFSLTGTSTAATVYADVARTTALSSPVVADAQGRFPQIYPDPAIVYRARLTDSSNVLQWQEDGLSTQLFPRTAAEIAAGVTPVNYAYASVYALRYGAPVDGTTSAVTQIGQADLVGQRGNQAIVFSPGTYFIGSNLTINSNLIMQSGAVLKVAAGVTLKLLGHVDAGPWQIYDLVNATTSLVLFGSVQNQWAFVTSIVHPEHWGARGVNGPNAATTGDTFAVQSAFESHRPVVFMQHYPVTQVITRCRDSDTHAFIAANEIYIDFNGFELQGIATSATKSVLDIKCGYSVLKNVQVSAQFNPLYECAIHWYTNDLSIYYPGFNRIYGMWARNALIGLCIGGLPSQAIPLPDQNAGAQPEGMAMDAPLSESTVFGYQSVSCVRGIWATQPNGKVHFDGAVVVGSNAGWCDNNVCHFGASGYTRAFTCALIIRNAPTQSTELHFTGGSIDQNSETAGTYLQITNGHLTCTGTIMEAQAPSYLAGFCQVSLSQILDFGFNFPAVYSPFLVDQNAVGYLNISDTTVNFPAGWFSSAAKSLVQGASNIAGSFGTNFGHFQVNFDNVELRDIPFIGSPTSYIPLAQGLWYSISNSTLTSYNSTPARTRLIKLDDSGASLLNGQVDVTSYSITAYGANGNAASGGWTFAVNDAVNCRWGSEPSGLTVEGYALDKALHLSTVGVGRTTSATSPPINVEPERTYQVKGWIKSQTASGAPVVVRLINFQFGGGASSTVASNFVAVPDTQFSATFQQLQGYVTIPKDTTKVQFFLYCESGADLKVAGLELL